MQSRALTPILIALSRASARTAWGELWITHRDDAGVFLSHYLENGLLAEDPFVSIDQKGVGALIAMAIEKGRAVNKKLHLGICGEHGGDPASIKFFHQLGLDYVSCSPYRVPTALLSAAQAAVETPAP